MSNGFITYHRKTYTLMERIDQKIARDPLEVIGGLAAVGVGILQFAPDYKQLGWASIAASAFAAYRHQQILAKQRGPLNYLVQKMLKAPMTFTEEEQVIMSNNYHDGFTREEKEVLDFATGLMDLVRHYNIPLSELEGLSLDQAMQKARAIAQRRELQKLTEAQQNAASGLPGDLPGYVSPLLPGNVSPGNVSPTPM